MLLPKDEGRDKVMERLEEAAASGKIESRIWATPGLPMLIFITLGLLCALVFGDIIWAFVRLLLG
jgi:prepilin signal peptidase PulO-like enzyme (type II secretory pathway)